MNAWQSPLIILASFAVYSVLHSVLAGHRFKAWAQARMGAAAYERYYRLLFNAVGVLTLLPILWLAVAPPDRPLYSTPYPWRWLSFAGQVAGLWLLAASLRVTGALDFLGLRQLAVEGGAAPELHIRGPYAWMRHPLYTGSMLVLWLFPEMTLNRLALIAAISLYFWLGAYYEERKLEAWFGATYTAYKARTPMFIPWRAPQD
jgi:protein-S-isoprenylcysteine O-methyltransferase Ste14